MRKNTPEEAEAKRIERNAANREWQRMLKEQHICPRCKRQDAYTLGGRRYCAECAAKMAENRRLYRAEHPVAVAEYRKMRREEMKKQNRCIVCDKVMNTSRYVTCINCRTRSRLYKAENRTCNFPRGENGICWQCNKRPVKEGFKLCQECYDVKVAICERNFANRDNTNHWWRK